ncbi:MAG: 5-methyltetrahydropteroyltriglutamate--homocysteine S-methyltransferase [Desulfovibrionaceae bacterium]
MQTHVLGFPRIGVGRELKAALERHWRGESSSDDLLATARTLKARHWALQRDAGLDFVATGDFSLYDHVLDMARVLGAVPARFGPARPDLDLYFAMARGDAARNVPALEMTKWFGTNYHYLAPEIGPDFGPGPVLADAAEDARLAASLGHRPKPVLVGPITWLSLARGVGGLDVWDRFEAVLAGYARMVAELGGLAEWIQLDEPILCADPSPRALAAFPRAYRVLNRAAGGGKILLATYFDALDDHLDLALNSGCAGLHLDLTRGAAGLDAALDRLPAGMVLSAGLVDGRNVWRTDLAAAAATLRRLADRLGPERVMAASSCSLLHCPMDLDLETELAPELKSWLAFAVQKCREVRLLADLAEGRADPGEAAEAAAAAAARRSRRVSPRVCNPAVRERAAAVDEPMLRRASPYPERKRAQAGLGLPELPTTTIGSFPQTAAIRAARRRLRTGELDRAGYEAFLRDEIRHVVAVQESLGLDVLVHGEAERNDMVEYFGQQLEGFAFTRQGWVQSYGSRCVKPPILYGDVRRPGPMTVDWLTFAQSLTRKPMKGMLTGPVTILCWSFVRDDQPRAETARQIALAIRDEVADLEAAGLRIIQIDEAAFSEGMPLKRRHRPEYLRWAVEGFRLATSGVGDATQIHSHMCYSEFNGIVDAIAAMDADVISIESSRSGMVLLDAFRDFAYPNEIGPGVWDIHSPRVPSEAEMAGLLQRALARIPRERLWVNPDCGLKTRDWPEVLASLRNMVAAAHRLRRA